MQIKLNNSTLDKSRSLLRFWPYAVGFVLAIVLSLAYAVAAQPKPNPNSQQVFQEQLRNQVETSNGSPQSGRDPASQKQNSLASAAAHPSNAGQRTDKPAAGVTGEKRQVQPSSVLQDSKKTGVLSNGCLADYGKPGEQCVPAHMVSKKPVTCAAIRRMFPEGVQVTGTDRFHLDTNHDKIACGNGDK